MTTSYSKMCTFQICLFAIHWHASFTFLQQVSSKFVLSLEKDKNKLRTIDLKIMNILRAASLESNFTDSFKKEYILFNIVYQPEALHN